MLKLVSRSVYLNACRGFPLANLLYKSHGHRIDVYVNSMHEHAYIVKITVANLCIISFTGMIL